MLEKRFLQKKPYLLLEILIGLTLISIISSLLFSFLIQSAKIETKMQGARQVLLERQHIQTTLQDIFATIGVCQSNPPMYTEQFTKDLSESLLIYFDHGIDPDPEFSGTIVAKLYLDSKQNLCLAYFPLKEAHPFSEKCRLEILARNVKAVSFEFLTKSEHKNTKKKFHWEQKWSKDNSSPPSFVKLTISTEKESLTFILLTPNIFPLPTYEESI